MSGNNKVSIITPVYNGEKHLAETIESVLAQTYTDWEMLIVDDGSTDGSAAIAAGYENKDPRIRLISQANGGSAAARNHGIEEAQGRYIALLDADDIWLPQFLSEQIKLLNEKNAICVCADYDHIDDESRDFGNTVHCKEHITVKDMQVMNQIGCLTGLYDSLRHGKIYLKEELRSLRDDYAYWYEIVSLEGEAWGNRQVLAKYRVSSGQTTGNKRKLISVQYHFYRDYLGLSVIRSCINVIRWGIAGLKKFSS